VGAATLSARRSRELPICGQGYSVPKDAPPSRAKCGGVCHAGPVEDIDSQILKLLSIDGRMSLADVARETDLSTSALHQRVKRLEHRGVITGYRALIDYREIGLPLTALVSLIPIDPSAPDDVPERLAEIAEIEACWSVAGAEAYVLKVRTADPADLEHLLGRIRAAANVSTRTTVVLSTAFENRPPALP
jgi:Lrp/AsnC family transcriptional regulator, leucine-responsive regulatory protein